MPSALPGESTLAVLRNIGTLAVCRGDGPQDDIHALRDAALAWEGATIAWVGSDADLPARFRDAGEHECVDADGRLVVPGLIDCHTHLAFGAWRADEFVQRLKGSSYLDIARAGGGIASTVRATREASAGHLRARCLDHLQGMAALGVTTIEAKSGYGLDVDTELRVLALYHELAQAQPISIVPTFLGAHTVPPEYRERRAAYVALLCDTLIPTIAAEGLARFCDVFVEETAFSQDEARQILLTGKAHGLAPKLHADQITDCGGAALAADVGAVSADHLEFVSTQGIRRMADAHVVAVSLPIATLYLNQRPMPARALIEAGVRVAVATDFNPGSAPSYHLPLAMMLASNLQRMTPVESLKGATIIAAAAIGMDGIVGSIEVGKSADFALIDAPDVNHWMYHFRANACVGTWKRGIRVYDAT